MLRVIFDTNIYGLLVEEKNIDIIGKRIADDKEFVIYGFKLIRKELRDVPKGEKLGKLKTRNLILTLYDKLTEGRYLENSIEIDKLALKFYNAYREFGGIKNWNKSNINIDFTLVACATFYKLDVVISDDSKTLLSKPALKAYKHICVKEGIWQPNLWRYSDLKIKFNF
ncbi:hypothetical protein J4442_00265 [Candidatus Woesearchaeota archaeon]|nr:hypothetical protein [Candidatus Woesearchaeota archaeon]